MKKIILLAATFFAFIPHAFALEAEDDFDGEEEGRLATKFRAFGSFPKSKQYDLPEKKPAAATDGSTPAAKDDEDLVDIGGGGVEFATEVFLTDHIATELAVGVGAYRTKKLENVAFNYEGSAGHATAAEPKLLWFAPISFGVKYFVAPFGAISPYFGIGYSYNIFFTMSDEYNVGNTHSFVVQGGLDFVTRDDTVYSIDVKKYMQKPEVRYADKMIKKDNSKEVTANLTDFSPIVISVGVGYKF
jgi:outer membrane protein W